MTADDLKEFMEEHKLSKSALFRVTGVARTTIDRYLDGTSQIPDVFALACMGICYMEEHMDEMLAQAKSRN